MFKLYVPGFFKAHVVDYPVDDMVEIDDVDIVPSVEADETSSSWHVPVYPAWIDY